jgi:predicted DNA-binding WGR domain protein
MMNRIYLVRHDAAKNMHRFYQLYVAPGVFGDWSLVREWGRVGSPGTVRKDWFDREEEAVTASVKLSHAKQKKGYQFRKGEPQNSKKMVR